MTRPAKPPMRARTSTVQRAPHGALHPLDEDAGAVEPFDDVHETDAAFPANANGKHDDGYGRGSSDANAAAIRGPSARRAATLAQDTRADSDSIARRLANGAGDDNIRLDRESPQPAHPDHPDAHEPLGPDDPLAPLPFNPYKGNRGITRAWHAMKNSLAGFQVAIREESAFRQELTLAAILLPCGIFVPVEPVARVLLLGSVLLVLIVELLNSSVEAAIDRISLERHELSRRAKDLGSAAVMVALGMCVMTWALIVGPLLVHWIGRWL